MTFGNVVIVDEQSPRYQEILIYQSEPIRKCNYPQPNVKLGVKVIAEHKLRSHSLSYKTESTGLC